VASTRRLAAVMFTDMVGYTASTQADEAGTLRLLREQEQIVRPLLAAHGGREVKSTGDGFLVEFESALHAVQCALDIQEQLRERNSRPGIVPLQIRIGVHLGDVEERAGDIFGDSVNLAARIQPLAEPGGICISEPVFGQVRNKLPNRLEKLGPRRLKGVQLSTDLYRVHLAGTPAPAPSARTGPARLAVLPFANISPDPSDEYFADGLTEEMITVLSQLRELRVIARTSVNVYKSAPKSVSQIGSELGVDAVLEGSVRKAGDRLRITVQLIDVGTQEHTWAGTYDRKLDNVFAVQSEIARRVAKQLKVRVPAAEEARLEGRPTVRPDSYLAYLKGRTVFGLGSLASMSAAQDQFELAISLDGTNAAARAGLADVLQMMRMSSRDRPLSKSGETGRALVDRAIELDPDLAEAHSSLGFIQWCNFEYAASESELRRALSLNPSYFTAHLLLAGVLQDEARPEEALVEFALAEEINPLSVLGLTTHARLLLWLHRYDEALAKTLKLRELFPNTVAYHSLMAQYYAARSERTEGVAQFRLCEELATDPLEKTLLRAAQHAMSGEVGPARALLREAESQPGVPSTDVDAALVYAEIGDLEGCFRMLERRVRDRYLPFQQWRLDPRLEHVRKDPRFATMLKEMNLS
jgi:adenylate cyclase